ncbi:MAG: hypothetical protein ACFFCV_19200 [Promethearchaeota archaeon]
MSDRYKQDINRIIKHTPIAQKTGILYNYWLAIPFMICWSFALTLQMLHGLLFDPTYHTQCFYANLMQLILWPCMYLFFNWVYRTTVFYVNEIMFEEKKFRNLFINNEVYLEYRSSFYKLVYSKKELILIILFIISQIFGVFTGFSEPTSLSTIYIIGQIIEQVVWFIAVIAIGSVAYYVITVFLKYFIFVKFENLSLSKYLNWFNNLIYESNPGDSQELQVTLYSFQNNTRVIGKFLFVFFFKFIFLLVCADLVVYLPSFFFPIDTGAAIYWVPGTMALVIFFVLSQYRIHSILKNAKENVIDGLNDLYNRFKQKLYQIFYEKDWEEKKGLMDQISFIQDELQEIKKMGTWTYDFPAILKMIATALITLIPLVLEYIPI